MIDDRKPPPIRVVLVNGVEVAHRLLAMMLQPYATRVQVVAQDGTHDARAHDEERTVVLFDTEPTQHDQLQRLRSLVDDRDLEHVVLFSWVSTPTLIDAALALGASGLILKGSEPGTIVEGIERVCNGEQIGLDEAAVLAAHLADHAFTSREQEVLALLALGLSNQEIGRELYLGVETIRTYVRQILRKLGVANRTQAALKAASISLELDDPRPSAAEAV
jgi:DNA-binding NarL/FixJ family response regulator